MASKVEEALEQEIAEVRAEIAASALGQKFARLVQTLKTYRGGDVVLPHNLDRIIAVAEMAEAIGPGKTGRSRSPERQAVIDAAAAYLRDVPRDQLGRPLPVRTITIYERLVKDGVHIPGTNPQNNLSAMLYNAREFVSHGRTGWTLREMENPADAESLAEPASTGLNDDLENQVEPPAQGGEARPGGGTS